MRPSQIGSFAIVATLIVGTATAQQQAPAPPTSNGAPSRAATLKDIEKTFGFVPQFFQKVPAAMLPAFWDSMKSFQMSTTTKLDPKTKELIGLAVASQIPCDYCIQFHTEAARKHGANDQEIEEAVGMAAMTRMGSTMLNGLQVDPAQFRRDLDRIMRKNTQAKQ
jgi:AhpD family alkylhydroperoxidase